MSLAGQSGGQIERVTLSAAAVGIGVEDHQRDFHDRGIVVARRGWKNGRDMRKYVTGSNGAAFNQVLPAVVGK